MLPTEPKHGDIIETNPGVIYQYDATINTWISIASSNILLPTATNTKPGVMTAEDLQKLNRLVIPPPASTIKGNDCPGPFLAGVIKLLSGDRYINIEGELDLQNIDQFGDKISKQYPFHIHQNTYGYNFNLDVKELAFELLDRGKLNLFGQTGDTGDKGEIGDPGVDRIISGPQGEEGEQGDAPECELSLQFEQIPVETQPDLNRAFSAVRVVPDPDDPRNHKKFALEFDRQVVGKPNASTTKFKVRQQDSYWILAVSSITSTPQEVYYLDIEPIIESVRNKFLEEVQLLKKGYEDIVKFWIQTMSDLFDEQKAALCCALEFCISKTKSTQLRQHMENVAASALPANIKLYGRDSEQAVEISSTRMLSDLPDNSDLCDNSAEFPVRPPPRVKVDQTGKCGETITPATQTGGQGYLTISVELGSGTGTVVLNYDARVIPDKFIVYYDGREVINTGYRGASVWGSRDLQAEISEELIRRGLPDEIIQSPGTGSASFEKTTSTKNAIVEVWAPLDRTRWDFELTCPPNTISPSVVPLAEKSNEFSVASAAPIEVKNFEPGIIFEINPLIHIGSNGLEVELPMGEYVATIIDTTSHINGKYRGNIRMQVGSKTIDFLDKGGFDTLLDSKAAYVGLTSSFKHNGGKIKLYFPVFPNTTPSGITKIMLNAAEDIIVPQSIKKVDGCYLSTDSLREYEAAWLSKECCGIVVRLGGQDYIIVKRSIDDDSCGGGESRDLPCIAEFIDTMGHPSIAWPTLDGKNFSPIPDVDEILFKYDQDYNDLIAQKMSDNDFSNPVGNPSGVRHLLHQLSTVLFPFS